MDHFDTSRFAFDDVAGDAAKICVIGVGGGGGNAVNNMVDKGIQDVDFIAINTDAQALTVNRAPQKLQAGRGLTKGLGTGARPNIGADSVMESKDEVEAILKGRVRATASASSGSSDSGTADMTQMGHD